MRTLVVGAGAVGGFFGGCLAQSGADVTFLVRPGRHNQLAQSGIRIAEAVGSEVAIPVLTVTAAELSGPYDLVLLATKGTALGAAVNDIAPAVGAETVILPLLNGMRHLNVLQTRFGAGRVLGGVCLVATELQPDGVIRQVAPGASIAFGELDGSASDRVRAVEALFAPADFESRVSETIVQEMWEKWFFMAAGGSATILLGGPAGAILAVEDGPAIIEQVIEQVAAVIAAEGHPVRAQARAQVAAALTTPGSRFATSLYRDFRAGRRTEVEPILGDLYTRALAHALDATLLGAATVRLRVSEAAAS
ncbi:2-dehydropantoate 2-reductase [Leifsonia shinshuensis]|uniref:2-dehydropantoate 2-reductase n=1 Tax=Leifsonia shinshuensis TaxID=150026 RepID=UPI00285AFBDC|nr:2-dehydropantoate 2-reductase [Leifsonia shinshuensis]MDR6972886.1 2-dehydropantoate 2-reductase [Leifsonia shinshuensis]